MEIILGILIVLMAVPTYVGIVYICHEYKRVQKAGKKGSADSLLGVVNQLTELIQQITVDMASGKYKGIEAAGIQLLVELREGVEARLIKYHDSEAVAETRLLIAPLMESVAFLEAALTESMNKS